MTLFKDKTALELDRADLKLAGRTIEADPLFKTRTLIISVT